MSSKRGQLVVRVVRVVKMVRVVGTVRVVGMVRVVGIVRVRVVRVVLKQSAVKWCGLSRQRKI